MHSHPKCSVQHMLVAVLSLMMWVHVYRRCQSACSVVAACLIVLCLTLAMQTDLATRPRERAVQLSAREVASLGR